MGATNRTSEGADATTSHQVRPHQANVTALDKESAAFKYLQVLFPKLSDAKVKAGIFVGPHIKKIIECDKFAKLLNRKQKTAWNSFVAAHGFLGNHKAKNYVQLVQTVTKNYAKIGCRISLKVHILEADLDKFKENMGAYSEEQGKRFHQDILDFEHCYQGQYDENLMGTTFGCLFKKVICSTLVNLEKLLISEPF